MNRSVVRQTESIALVKVPLPFPLQWVNSYLIRENQAYTVMDPGIHTSDTEQLWQEVLREQGITFAQIKQIIVTHYHPDHFGLAGWMQQQSGANVLISRESYRLAQLSWGTERIMPANIVNFYAMHGMDAATLSHIREHLASFEKQVHPFPEVQWIEPQDNIQMGGLSYGAIMAGGHASGQLIFYNADQQILFCGDQVLERISPNISLQPLDDANPLLTFLTSLKQLSKLPVKIAYTGHRDPIAAFTERTQELISHHEKRLQQIQALLVKPTDAYELCRMLFSEHLSIHQLRFAMAETLAHLVYLRERGEVFENCVAGIYYFGR